MNQSNAKTFLICYKSFISDAIIVPLLWKHLLTLLRNSKIRFCADNAMTGSFWQPRIQMKLTWKMTNQTRSFLPLTMILTSVQIAKAKSFLLKWWFWITRASTRAVLIVVIAKGLWIIAMLVLDPTKTYFATLATIGTLDPSKDGSQKINHPGLS